MEPHDTPLQGIWLPLITPFRDGALDETSLHRLVTHYAGQPVDGLILAATTGEGLSLDDDEGLRLVSVTRAALGDAGRQIPIYFGLSGGDTGKMIKAMARTAASRTQGSRCAASRTASRVTESAGASRIAFSSASRSAGFTRSTSPANTTPRTGESASAS